MPDTKFYKKFFDTYGVGFDKSADGKSEVDGKVRKVYLKDLKKDEQAKIDKLHGYSLVLGPYVASVVWKAST